jgi:hypothetical protein
MHSERIRLFPTQNYWSAIGSQDEQFYKRKNKAKNSQN